MQIKIFTKVNFKNFTKKLWMFEVPGFDSSSHLASILFKHFFFVARGKLECLPRKNSRLVYYLRVRSESTLVRPDEDKYAYFPFCHIYSEWYNVIIKYPWHFLDFFVSSPKIWPLCQLPYKSKEYVDYHFRTTTVSNTL
jgi:hypothetical protein